MQPIKTSALIAKVMNLNDNDRLYTILTKEHGKITAMAKGVRSHKHKDFAALQLFCYSNFVLLDKNGLYYVSSAEVINNFFDLRTGVEKISLATYIMDIVNSVTGDICGDDEYFAFILNTLYLIGKSEQRAKDGDIINEIRRLKIIFELKTTGMMGYMPDVDSCAICGKNKELNRFDIENGSLVCENCTDKAYSLINVTKGAVRGLNYIFKSDYKSVFSFSCSDEIIDILDTISEKYLSFHTETFYQSLDYLKNILYK